MFMEMRSGNRQAEMILNECNSLIDKLKFKIISKSNPSQGLTSQEIQELLSAIINPMNNLGIHGDEALLDDLLDISDKVQETIKSALKLRGDEQLSDAERKALEVAKKNIEKQRKDRLDPIDKTFTNILTEYSNGRLFNEFIDREVREDKEVRKLRKRLNSIGTKEDIERKLDQNESAISKISPEIQAFAKYRSSIEECGKIQTRLDDIELILQDDTVSDEDKEEKKEEKAELQKKKIDKIIESNPEFSKNQYKQKQDENLETYIARLEKEFEAKVGKTEKDLSKKLVKIGTYRINIATEDTKNETYKISNKTIDDIFGEDLSKVSNINRGQLLDFAKTFTESFETLKIAATSRDDLEGEIEEKRREIGAKVGQELELQLQEEEEREHSNTPAVITPYDRPEDELTNGQKKWQRRWFKFWHPIKTLGAKTPEEIEDAMIRHKEEKMGRNAPQTQQQTGDNQNNNENNSRGTMALNRQELLKTIEKHQKEGANFKQAYRVQAETKNEIFDRWHKEMQAKEEQRKKAEAQERREQAQNNQNGRNNEGDSR